MINKLKPKSEFSRNVLTLMTGTTIAQAIPIAISPILTRIYTPEDFGIFALFISISAIFSSISSGRYELAIMLPKKDEDAINILAIGIIINFIVFIFLYLIVFIFSDNIIILLKNDSIKYWLYFIPITVLLIGFFNLLSYFNNRKKFYKDIANSTIIKSIILTCTQLIIGFLKNGEAGLILGELFSRFFANMKLLKNIIVDKKLLYSISLIKILALLKKYKNFPKYSVPAILANTLSGNLINIFIPILFNVGSLGFYSLAERILGVPTSLIGKSISQVYYQEISNEYKQTKKIASIYVKTLKKLFIMGIILFGFLYFTVIDLFIIVFGENWKEGGEYAQLLIFLYFCRFIVSPLTVTPLAVHKVNIDLFFQSLMLVLILIIFSISYFLDFEILHFLNIFSFLYGLYYLLYLLYLNKFLKNYK